MSDDECGFDNDIEEFSEIEYSGDEEEEEFDLENEEEEAVNEVEIGEEEKEKEEEEVEEEPIIVELDKEEEVEIEKKKAEKIDKDKRITFPFLTKYEKAKVIGARAIQLSQGAKSMVKFQKFDPIEIAKVELSQKNLPLIIRRYLPSGKYEDWSISELQIF